MTEQEREVLDYIEAHGGLISHTRLRIRFSRGGYQGEGLLEILDTLIARRHLKREVERRPRTVGPDPTFYRRVQR